MTKVEQKPGPIPKNRIAAVLPLSVSDYRGGQDAERAQFCSDLWNGSTSGISSTRFSSSSIVTTRAS